MEDARIFFRTQVRLPEGKQFQVSLGSGVHAWRTQARNVFETWSVTGALYARW